MKKVINGCGLAAAMLASYSLSAQSPIATARVPIVTTPTAADAKRSTDQGCVSPCDQKKRLRGGFIIPLIALEAKKPPVAVGAGAPKAVKADPAVNNKPALRGGGVFVALKAKNPPVAVGEGAPKAVKADPAVNNKPRP